MKKILFIGLASVMSLGSFESAYGDWWNWSADVSNSLVFNGSADLKNRTRDDVLVNGSAAAENSSFGSLEVHGSLKGKKLEVGSTLVHGAATLLSSKFDGVTEIHGSLRAKDNKFHSLRLLGDTFYLWDSAASSITVRSSKRESEPVLILQGDTVVSGNITFQNGGEVILQDDAKILGEVKGGRLSSES